MKSNYERMKRQMEKEFLTYNQDQMITRFPISASETYLSFDFMGGVCRVDRKIGRVECSYAHFDEFREADYNEAMTVYDLLCWSKPDAVPAGQFVTMQGISKLHRSSPGSSSDFFSHEAKLFDHQNALLSQALEKLGGILVDDGDVAAQISVFHGLNLLFRYWNSDDEFAPAIQFLWDANVLSFMHYETVWFANHVLIRRICEIWDFLSQK